MNILFLSLSEFNSIKNQGIYTDLLREFEKHGHDIYVVSPLGKNSQEKEKLIREGSVDILRINIGSVQKTGIIKKGINTILLERKFVNAIKKFYSNVKFDLVLYPTPPITLFSAVKYIKKRDGANAYLMLKDIFPQGAVDLGLLGKGGIKGIIYSFFRRKEKKLYKVSDYIGCMSQANVDYIILNNKEINKEKVEICPNSINVIDKSIDNEEKRLVRIKYGIPLDKKIFIYGGNLGKPQGVDFLISCLKKQVDNENAFFLIIGDGTEFNRLEQYNKSNSPKNMKLMKSLPKEEYDKLVAACDVGMLFLDYRFTIPNFPSRLLTYMQVKIPVFAVTDTCTDVGKVISEGGFGWWCSSDNIIDFSKKIDTILSCDYCEMREKEWEYLNNNYNVNQAYEIIMKHFS